MDGEPIVPCAQGRIVIETTHPAPPHFATCSTYRHTMNKHHESPCTTVDSSPSESTKRGTETRNLHQRQYSLLPQKTAIRPEDLQLTPWYAERTMESIIPAPGNVSLSSYPSSFFSRNNNQLSTRPDIELMRESSTESDVIIPRSSSSVPRKAYMDLRDAIALLDETCPNPDASPLLSPRTPRTLITLTSRNKRPRSKSSDNSSNYVNERQNHRAIDSKEREKRRPFLKKIGISKTEDKPFLLKNTPKMTGKPYLEKIGTSKAVERPFLEKIGSSKTLDKFTFETLKEIPRAMMRRTQTIIPEPTPIERHQNDEIHDSILVVEEEELPDNQVNTEKKRSGKGLLLKMYSFETEDLDDNVIDIKFRRNFLRQTSYDDVVRKGPSSLPPLKNMEKTLSSEVKHSSPSDAELLKCRVTTSEEIIFSSTGYVESPKAAASWSNSPKWSFEPSMISKTLECNFNTKEIFLSDEERVPNSPTKRRISKVSPEPKIQMRVIPTKTKNSSLSGDFNESPIKTRRQISKDFSDNQIDRISFKVLTKMNQIDQKTRNSEDEALNTRRQTFNEALEKFGGTNFVIRTNRETSEDIFDKSKEKNKVNYEIDSGRAEILSHNNKCLKENNVESAALSFNSRSGSDSPLACQQPSYSSKDIFKSTFTNLGNKFEVQDVPPESYAAFKRRIKPGYQTLTERFQFTTKETIIPCPSIETSKVFKIKNMNSKSRNEMTRPDSKGIVRGINKKEQVNENAIVHQMKTIKSVLKKQDGIDQSNDEEIAGSLKRRPLRKIFHEPSQETMDLLTELKKIKSLLRTPSDESKDWKLDFLKPPQLPKRISLSDKEFCLSTERENSIRRSSILKQENKTINQSSSVNQEIKDHHYPAGTGPALFEQRCLSLNYADDMESNRHEKRVTSVISAKKARPETIETSHSFDQSLLDDSKTYLYEGLTLSSDDPDINISSITITHQANKNDQKKIANNSFEVDIAIPVDQRESTNSKKRVQIQGRPSDLYEIISPRLTPFRIKKRLGRISIEESVTQESFTIDKVDCRSSVTQKKTKCFPL